LAANSDRFSKYSCRDLKGNWKLWRANPTVTTCHKMLEDFKNVAEMTEKVKFQIHFRERRQQNPKLTLSATDLDYVHGSNRYF